MRAALYLRRSTDRQEASLSDQRREVTDLAKRRGYRIVAEYVDDGISGDATEKRLQFQAMIRDAAAKRFDLVLCWDQDRFGRFDPLEAGFWIKPMRDAGVMLETVAQGKIDWNDFAGRLLYTVTQEGKHAYLRDLARNCNRGVRQRIEAGVWSGLPPYGYARGDDGKLVLGPAACVAAVRRVFALRSQGNGYRTITLILEQEGHPSPRGAPWCVGNIRDILAREVYTGTLVVGRNIHAKYEPLYDQVHRILDCHPAIITPSEWAGTRPELFRGGKPHRRSGKYPAALGGMMHCGDCGATMYVHQHNGELGYVCGTYHRGQGCGFCRVSEQTIRSAIVDVIEERLNAIPREKIRSAVSELLGTRGAPQATRTLSQLDRQIVTASERLLLVPASALGAAQRKIAELSAERARVAAEQQMDTAPKLSVTQVMKRLDTLAADLKTLAPDAARGVFAQLIASVRLDFRQLDRGVKRRFFAWKGGEITFADNSPKQGFCAPDSALFWSAARAIVARGKKIARIVV